MLLVKASDILRISNSGIISFGIIATSCGANDEFNLKWFKGIDSLTIFTGCLLYHAISLLRALMMLVFRSLFILVLLLLRPMFTPTFHDLNISHILVGNITMAFYSAVANNSDIVPAVAATAWAWF